jgi:hypothetical protein
MPSSSLPITRRHFLRGAGALVALPMLESLPVHAAASRAGSQPAAPAGKRLVCLGVALSMYPGEWQPKQGGTGYALPRLLEPLAGLRKDFTVITGVDHPGVTGGHKGTPAFLSGVYQPERVGQAIVIHNQVTLDQFAAPHLGKNTRFESLQLGAAPDTSDGALSWDPKGVPLLGESDPARIFKKLFVNEADPAAADRAILSGKSVLDLVMAEARELSGVIAREDQQRMDEYLSAVRDVEVRIERQRQWLHTPKPGVPPLTERPTTYHENLDLVLELTALALQTDSTRVVSVDLPGSGLPIVWGNSRVGNYHGQSHHGMDPKVIEELVAIERLHTASLAKFLQRLKSTPSGAGTLLDETQVLFGSGLGNGSSHSNRDLPVLLAGGGLRHGRHLALPPGTPLCNVFVTMLQRMGIDAAKFAGSTGNVNNEIA